MNTRLVFIDGIYRDIHAQPVTSFLSPFVSFVYFEDELIKFERKNRAIKPLYFREVAPIS
jgi:hypothetical protein